MKKSVCMIMAHADDIEFSAGGTLAKYISDGYRALYGVLSRCNSGWTVDKRGGRYVPSLEIIPKRRREAKAAAKVFGAKLYQADLLENCYLQHDGTVLTANFSGWTGPADDVPAGVPLAVAAGAGDWLDHPVIGELASTLAEWEPELVVGQPFQNGNPDHFCAALILARAYRIARRNAEIGPLWIPVATSDRENVFPTLSANRFVDVTGHEETCLKALACHKSQGGHLRDAQDGLRAHWRKWGEIRGCQSAEGFVEM